MAGNDEDCFGFEDDDDEDFLLASELLESTLAGGQNSNHALPQPVPGTSTGVSRSTFGVGSHLPGFDIEAGQTWIYPTNYPVREYQFSIVQKGLFENTLVSLPTGLGKTFIAAVIMYNFYRWYPRGKIIFMAPTKPLVAQQIEACFNVMGIPQNHMAEMTGTMLPAERKTQWNTKRVFFLTPQVMMNDLNRGACPAELVKCLVVDEAHKALGNHAYAVVVRDLMAVSRQFRVLALSATPGSDVKSVQQIINNLLISRVEIRTEESIDIMPYTHARKVVKIVVPLGEELEDIKKRYLQIVSFYLDWLKRKRVLSNVNPENLSKFVLLKERDGFRQNPPETLPRSEFGHVESNFAMSISLIHAYELLCLHGARSFYHFLKGIVDGNKGQQRAKSELQRMQSFCQLMGELEAKFNPIPFSNDCPSSSQARVPLPQSESSSQPYVVSHPKMQKLLEIVLDHFKIHQEKCRTPFGVKNKPSTRVMIFSQYRDSVQEITEMLNHHQPLIKAMSFVGQASSGKACKGLTQKLQLQVVTRFRTGGYNTLVSTCVGEEGLDIGEVDLIICYDAHKSPIRLVQRMGRTGRQREGQIIMLVTKGKEEKIYNQGQANKRTINRTIAKGSEVYMLYQDNPRMVPRDFEPVCHKMLLTPGNYEISAKRQRDTAILNHQLQKVQKSDSPFCSEDELKTWFRYRIPEGEAYHVRKSDQMLTFLPQARPTDDVSFKNHSSKLKYLSVSEWLPWQTSYNTSYLVSHTKNCDTLVKMMHFIDVLRHLPSDDNSYEIEMLPYLDKNDVLRCGVKEVHKGNPLISDFFPTTSPQKSQKSACSSNRVAQSKLSPAKVVKNSSHKALEKFAFDVESDKDFVPLLGRIVEEPQCASGSGKVDTKASPCKMVQSVDVKENCGIADLITVEENSVSSTLHTMFPEPPESSDIEEFFQLPSGVTDWKSPWITNPANFASITKPLIKTPPPSPPDDMDAFRIWLYECSSHGTCKSSNLPEKTNNDYSGIKKISENVSNLNWDLEDFSNSSDDDLFRQALPVPLSLHTVGVPTDFNDNRPLSKSPVFSLPKKSSSVQETLAVSANQSKLTHVNEESVSLRLTDNIKNSSNSNWCAVSDELLGSGGFDVHTTSAVHFHQKPVHNSGMSIPKVSGDTIPGRTTKNECKKLILNFDLTESDSGDDDVGKERNSESCQSFDSDIIPPSPEVRSRMAIGYSSSLLNSNLKKSFNSKPLSTIVEEQPSLSIKRLCLSPIIGVNENREELQNPSLQKSPALIAFSTPVNLATVRRSENQTPDADSVDVVLVKKRMKQNGRKLDLSLHDENLQTGSWNVRQKKRKRKVLWKQFIEEEAEVVGSECSPDEDVGTSTSNVFGDSFIDDDVQLIQEAGGETNDIAMYLRSIRSPCTRPGAFKLMPCSTSTRSAARKDVYSQQRSSQESDYQQDSFCVSNDFVEFAETQEMQPQMGGEKSEQQLLSSSKALVTSKRRRVYTLEDSSTTDEDGDIAKACQMFAVESGHHLSLTQCHSSRSSHSVEQTVIRAQSSAPEPAHKSCNTSSSSLSMSISNYSMKITSSPAAVTKAVYVPTILVDGREVSASQGVLSALRLQHRAQMTIAPLAYCDFIVSNRMAVERKLHSDVANPVLRRKLLQRIRDMLSVFERPCLIIENDRAKPNEQPRQTLPIKYYNNTLACLAQTPVKILLSQSQEQTADIIVELGRREWHKGNAISAPTEVDITCVDALKFYLSLPNLSYVAALNFCHQFRSIREFFKSSVDVIAERGKISKTKAELIHKYLYHRVS